MTLRTPPATGPLIAAAAALLLASPLALADDTDERVLRKRIEIIGADDAKGNVFIGEAGSGHDLHFGESHSVDVSIDDGQVHVRVDGEDIPAGRVIQKDGRIIILDDENNEIRRIEIGRFGPEERVMEFRFGDGENHLWIGGDGAKPVDPPKVMLGVQLGAPGAALERHLRLESGTTTMITALYEGLPAHAAGLAEFDIITRLDGDAPADPKSLHAALGEKEAGDRLRLTIIHEGEEKQVRVKLAAYDHAALASATLLGGSGAEMLFGNIEMPDVSRFGAAPGLNRFFLDKHSRVFELPSDGKLEWIEEDEPGEPRGDLDARLHRLDRRLAGLEKLLDELLEHAKGDR